MDTSDYSFFLTLVLALTLLSCNSDQTSSESAKSKLVGEWRNVSIEVTMETVHGSDSSKVFTANQENWVQKLGIQPIRTTYSKDGSYRSRYYAPNDSLVQENFGKWEVKNDSLYMYQTQPDSVTYVSAFSVKNDTARFVLTLDWDQDGANDDHYVGVQYKHQE